MRFVLVFLAIAFAIGLRPAQAATVPSAHVCAYQQIATDLQQAELNAFFGLLSPGSHAALDAYLKAHATGDIAALAVLGRWQTLSSAQHPLVAAANDLLLVATDDAASNENGAVRALFNAALATAYSEAILLSQGAASCPVT